jgi:PKD repeat protein
VTVTADDGQGHAATASFTLTVNALAPSARIVTDPATVPEGTSEPFTGAATTAFAGDSAGLSYSWRVTKNGAAYSSGAGTGFSFTPNDDGTYVVTFQATDDGAMSGSDSMTVIGTNVAPTAHVSVGQSTVTVAQQSVAFSGSFTDPGVLDTHRVTWNFGDGTSSTANYGPGGSANFSAAHAYTAAGTYTVRLTVTDDDGGAGLATATVLVQTTQQALSRITGLVNAATSLSAVQKNSLVAKLNAASASAGRGDNKACNNQLNAFLNELDADVKTGKISSTQAGTISTAVYAVKGSLGSYNRFLEWWPLAE